MRGGRRRPDGGKPRPRPRPADGRRIFFSVGNALLTIRDGKLYRASLACDGKRVGTFEEYCQERWNISRPRAYQLIGAAEAVSTMVDKGIEPPATERQARPLAKLPPADQPAAWQERQNAPPLCRRVRRFPCVAGTWRRS